MPPFYRWDTGLRELLGLAHGLSWYEAQLEPGPELRGTMTWML